MIEATGSTRTRMNRQPEIFYSDIQAARGTLNTHRAYDLLYDLSLARLFLAMLTGESRLHDFQ